MWDGYFDLGTDESSVEIINVARTEAYLEQAGASWFKPLFAPTNLVDLLGDDAYVDPATDNAPWYDSAVPHSAEFYGAYPLDVDGLDSSSGSAAMIASILNGGQPGAVRFASKSGVYNVMLVAASSLGAAYGRQWLSRALLGPCGVVGGCDGLTLAYLLSDPGEADSASPGACFDRLADRPADPIDLAQLLIRTLRKVTVVSPLTVTSKRTLSDGACIWLATFTLSAGNAYEHSNPVPFLSGWTGVTPFANPDFEVNTTGWGTGVTFFNTTGATLTRITSDFDTGVAAAQVVTTAASAAQGVNASISVPANTTAKITARVKRVSGRPVLLRLRDTTNSVSGTTATSVNAAGGTDYETLTSTITTGPLAATVVVNVSDDTTAGVSTFILDTLTADWGNPWPLGSPPAGASVSVLGYTGEVECNPPAYTPITDPLYPGVVPPPTPPGIEWGTYVAPAFWRRRVAVLPASLVPGWTELVPVITVTPAADEQVRNVRIRFYEDPLETGQVPEDTCSHVGDIVVTYVPEDYVITADGRDEIVYIDTPLNTRQRADQLVFGSQAGPIKWPRLTCGQAYVITFDVDSAEILPSIDVTLVERSN